MTIARLHPLQKSVITGPDVPKDVHLRVPGKDPNIFPLAKYVVIAKTYESKQSYKVFGIPRRTKVYGVGVLTDKNEYYYSELHTRHTELTCFNRDMFQRTLTSKYRFDEHTRVQVTDNITDKDPIYAFVSIVGSAVGYHIKTSNFANMTRTINNRFRFVKNVKKNNYSTRKWHARAVLDKMIRLKRFDFLTDPNWYEKISNKAANAKKAFLICAVAIVYIYTKDLNNSYLVEVKKHRLEKKMEELRKSEENKQ